MPTSLFQYEMLPTTWFYVSSLIILATFFRFNRFWSVRNLDLIGLILFTPGLLWLAMCDDRWGYVWIFGIGLLMVVRLLFDTVMVRRPLLEPNLTPGGLSFACFFLLCFIVAALSLNRGDHLDTVRTVRLEHILTTRHIQQKFGMYPRTMSIPKAEWNNLPPGFRPFWFFTEQSNLVFAPSPTIRVDILKLQKESLTEFSKPVSALSDQGHSVSPLQTEPAASPTSSANAPLSTSSLSGSKEQPEQMVPPVPKLLSTEIISPDESLLPEEYPIQAPSLGMISLILTIAISGHLLLVLAFIFIGHCHFGNIRTGIACATLYLLIPYTSQMIGRLDHLVPSALILWGVAMYRRPFFAGLWIGIAAALVFYPACLLPLWCSFYWKRGCFRYLCGFGTAIVLALVLLFFSPSSLGAYGEQVMHLFGKSGLLLFTRPEGFWGMDDLIYRVPVLAVFGVFSFGLILWPSHKHLATLLSCSALLMLCVQYCQVYQGGLYMAWYLPLLILTIFRPNLEDRVAQSTVAQSLF